MSPYKPGVPQQNGAGEADVVDGQALARILQRFCIEWLADRPAGTESSRSDKPRKYAAKQSGRINPEVQMNEHLVFFMGPIQYISSRSGIHIRRVSGMCNGEFERIGLSQADAVLTAINLNHLLMSVNGRQPELKIFPNPKWSMEKYQEYMRERGCV